MTRMTRMTRKHRKQRRGGANQNGTKKDSPTLSEEQEAECTKKIKEAADLEGNDEEEDLNKLKKKDILDNFLKTTPFPFNYVVNPIFKLAVQSTKNLQRVKQTLSNTEIIITTNAFKSIYEDEKFTEECKSELKYACKIIKRLYDSLICNDAEHFTVSNDSHASCRLSKSLIIQNRLFNSTCKTGEDAVINCNTNYDKDINDFFNIFNNSSRKFENFYNEVVAKLPDKPMDHLVQEVMHKSIENLFIHYPDATKEKEQKDGKDCSYIILDLLKSMNVKDAHDEANRIGYIDYCDLADIKYIKNDNKCGSINAFVDMAKETGITSAIESAIGAKAGGLDPFVEGIVKKLEDGVDPLSSFANSASIMENIDVSKLDPTHIMDIVGDPSKISKLFSGNVTNTAKNIIGKIPGASDIASKMSGVNNIVGKMPDLKGFMGGTKRYKRSRRALPKKRRLTIRRVKLTK